jgi:hypothetical protein
MAQNRHKIPISGYNPKTKELFFSWSSSQSSSNLPDRTISFNLEYGHASYIDHGFTAMINYQSYNQMALRDFLLEVIVAGENAGICSCDDTLDDILQGDPYVLGRDSTTTVYPSLWKTGENTGTCNLSQYTDEWNCVANDGTWTPTNKDVGSCSNSSYTTEATCEAASATWTTGSLCSALDDKKFDFYCEGGTEGGTFVMASAEDLFLKEYDTNYYSRNMHTPVAGHAAIYNPIGYESILESGAFHFDTDGEKTLQRITVEYSGVSSDVVTAAMKFGKANQPDLLLTGSAYTTLTGVELLNYQSSASTSDIEGNLISPDDKAYFNNYTRGRYIGYQLKLTGAGAATLSRLTLSTRLAEK